MTSSQPFASMMFKHFGLKIGRRVTCREIIERVAKETGIPASELRGSARRRPVAHARQHAYRLMYMAGHGYSHIGRFMHRDHSTVIHGVRKAAEL